MWCIVSKYNKKWRNTKIAQGICGTCGKNPLLPNRKDCSSCRDKRAAKQKERYQRNKVAGKECKSLKREQYKKNGLCSRCGLKTPKDGQLTCTHCLEKLRAYVQILKDKVYSGYGGYHCVCCGETVQQFLTLDHIANDGAKHRADIFGGRNNSAGSGRALYCWIIRNNFPDLFQVLCMNCNWGKRMNNGVCPHKNQN